MLSPKSTLWRYTASAKEENKNEKKEKKRESLFCLKPFSPQDQVKYWNFGHLRNLSPPSEKVKKVDLRGQKDQHSGRMRRTS
jgi:hypothetical protein